MRKAFIPRKNIVFHHPFGLKSSTDGDYANFAGTLLTALQSVGVEDIMQEVLKDIAINLTMYFEDVVADAGIWRGFTDKMQAMYGKYLPFYDIDEATYLRDEPNLVDVEFLVWDTIVRNEDYCEYLLDPWSSEVEDLATKAYGVMLDWFEVIPVNDELKNYFEEARFMDDLWNQQDLLFWLCYSCYLTCIPDFAEKAAEEVDECCKGTKFDENLASDLIAVEMPYRYKVGPLALKTQEWLGAILRANGNTEKAEWAERQRFVPVGLAKVIDVDECKGVTFEIKDGERILVACEELRQYDIHDYSGKYVLGSFSEYQGRWFPNPEIFAFDVSEYDAEYDNKRSEEKRVMAERYAQLLEESGGNPFFYFKDWQELRTFLVEKLGEENPTVKNPAETAFVLAVSSKTQFHIWYSDCAKNLKDERNPYYDEEYSKVKALAFALNIPSDTLQYAMEHDMLPYVAFASDHDDEFDRKKYLENYEILQRVYLREHYDGFEF